MGKADGMDDRERAHEDARKAAARMRRERDELKSAAEERERKAAEESGRFEDLYKAERADNEKLREELATERATRHALTALNDAGFRKPARAVRLLDLKNIEDEHDARREARALAEEDPDLVRNGRRQGRSTARDEDDDTRGRDRDRGRDREDDRDERTDRKQEPAFGPERLRRTFAKNGDRQRSRN
jgi:hypothetical protein